MLFLFMTILIFLIVLSVLVLAHEYGHFVTAKRAGAKVEEFGFGFPPKVFSVTRNGTVFSFNLIPFGGFVKIFGESGEHRAEPGSFGSLKIFQRAKILVAGVTMNVILAFALLSIVNLVGRPAIVDETNAHLARDIKIQILDVAPESPAEKAGLKTGDVMAGATVGGSIKEFQDISEFKSFVEGAAGKEILLNIKRSGEALSVKIVPRENPPAEEGALGVALARTGVVKSPWYLFLWNGLKDTLTMIGVIAAALFLFFKTLILEGRLMGEVAGPVGIAALTGQAYTMGLTYLFNLMAILSVNLAILNILPFPALDGGRLLFLAVEKIKGSPVSHKIENAVNAAGFALLIALMVFVTWQDIARFF